MRLVFLFLRRSSGVEERSIREVNRHTPRMQQYKLSAALAEAKNVLLSASTPEKRQKNNPLQTSTQTRLGKHTQTRVPTLLHPNVYLSRPLCLSARQSRPVCLSASQPDPLALCTSLAIRLAPSTCGPAYPSTCLPVSVWIVTAVGEGSGGMDKGRRSRRRKKGVMTS